MQTSFPLIFKICNIQNWTQLMETAYSGWIFLIRPVLFPFKKLSLCWGLTARRFCLLKCSLCQIIWLRSHKFLLCCGSETWQTTRCSSINHCLQFTTCETSQARKRLPLAATADRPLWEENKKLKYASLSVVKLWGLLDASSVVIHYDDRLWLPMHIDRWKRRCYFIHYFICCKATALWKVLICEINWLMSLWYHWYEWGCSQQVVSWA